jgi:hypothetical protein
MVFLRPAQRHCEKAMTKKFECMKDAINKKTLAIEYGVLFMDIIIQSSL